MSNPPDLPPLVAALPRGATSTSSNQPQPGSPRSFFAAAVATRRRIAIAVDLSKYSAYAVRWAVENQLRPGDAVVVLHVACTTSVTLASPEHDADAAARRREAGVDVLTSKAVDLEAGLPASKVKDQAEPLEAAARGREAGVDGLTSKSVDLEADVDSLPASKVKDQAEPLEAAARRSEPDVAGLSSKAVDLEAAFDSTIASKVRDQAEPLEPSAEIQYMIHIVKDNKPGDRICDEIKQLNVALLIMASQGAGAAAGGSKAGLGSICDHCVRNCACPVLVVRPPVDGGARSVDSNVKGLVAVYSRRKKGIALDSRKPKTKAGVTVKIENGIRLKCSVQEAMDQSIREKKLLLVYISGEDKTSRRNEQCTFVEKHVVEMISRSCIFLQVKHGSPDELDFSATHKHMSVPSVSAIGINGVTLWHHEGYVSPDDLTESIQKAWAELHLQASKIALIYDERMLEHRPPKSDTVIYHERPERLSAIYEKLEKDGILNSCHVYKAELVRKEDLSVVHSKQHVDDILSISEEVQCEDEEKAGLFSDKDLYRSSGTKRAIQLAAGGAVQACSMVARGIHRTAFALIRPPGHHASRNKAGGFCFVNNLAVGAGVLLNEFEMENVLALDWDIHHGDGTQDIFLKDKRVLTFSLHRSAKLYYPPSDKTEDTIGDDCGEGYNVNICWARPHVKDDDFYYVWKQVLMPIARQFKPQIILIACGFDAALGDQLGECDVTPKGYATLLSELNDLSIELNIGLVMTLEGGYNLESIGNSASACLKVLSGDKSDIGDINECRPRGSTLKTVNKIKEKLRPFWPVLTPPEV